MNSKIKALLAVCMVAVLALMTAACGGSEKKTEDENVADLTIEGELIDAQSARLVVSGTDRTIVMNTDTKTEYELGDANRLRVGDQLKVDYHQNHGTLTAMKVEVLEASRRPMVFGGTVMEITGSYLTVHSETMTVVFNFNKRTEVEGKLSEGDTVTVSYQGDLSTNPYARSVAVIQEKPEIKKKDLHGTVSEVSKKSVVVSVDSAHAARIKVTGKTKIKGDAKDLKIGDEVNVVYVGKAGANARALTIKVTRKNSNYFIMDGVIAEVAEDKLVVETQKKKYTFKVVDGTRIENLRYLRSGHKTTVTYIGKLDKNPTAASIFCSRDTITAEEKRAAKKKATEKKAAEEQKKKEAEARKKQAEKRKKEREKQKKLVIEAEGEVIKWENPCIIQLTTGVTLELDITDATISAGYIPEEGDRVIIKYEKDTMKLRDMQISYRPDPDDPENPANQ